MDGDGGPLHPAGAKPKHNDWDAETVFKWVRASRIVKQIRLMKDSRNDFYDLAGEEVPADIQQAAKERPGVSYDVIRKGRVKLDMVMMNVFRSYFRTLTADRLWISLFIDASPQKRGYELFAISLDFVFSCTEQTFKYRRQPSHSLRFL
jgi:hypothetical protein